MCLVLRFFSDLTLEIIFSPVTFESFSNQFQGRSDYKDCFLPPHDSIINICSTPSKKVFLGMVFFKIFEFNVPTRPGVDKVQRRFDICHKKVVLLFEGFPNNNTKEERFSLLIFQELRKLIGHFLKLNTNLVSPGQKFLTGLQAKLHYLKIISELPSYGAKCFSTNMSVSTSRT